MTPNDPNAAAQTVGSPPFNAGGGGNGGGGTAIPPAGYNITGALGGLQAGYNWQFNRSWLLGVEVDFNGADIKGSGASNFFFGGPAAANMTASQKVDWFGTVRARVGWLPSDNLLLFATGGFAYGHVKQDVALNQPTGISNSTSLLFSYSCIGMPSRCFAGSSSQVANGWAAGAGAEYAISQNVTLKAEYLHVDFGDTSAVNVVAGKVGFPGTTPSSFTAKFSDLNFNVVRVGANYRF